MTDVSTTRAERVASLPSDPNRARWRTFPWSIRGALFVMLVTAAALGCVLVANPAVSTADIQRRDRLSAEGRFVDATYRYFLGRPADIAGQAEYQALYEREGPRAVAGAIVASQEYALRHPGTADATAQADAFVRLYDAGGLSPTPPPDWPGRLGFVVLLALSASALVGLQRAARRGLAGSALHMYVPHWLLVSVFGALACIWFLNTQALFYAFAPGAIGYTEWLDRTASLLVDRGLARVWTPYPQATPLLLVALEAVARVVSGWLSSDVWTRYTVFRWLFQALFLLVPSVLAVSITYRLGILMSPASATLGATLVAFSFAPLYYGLTSTVVTDPLPVCITVVALWFVLRDRPVWAGVALGLAAAMKLIPLVVLVPIVVLALSRRRRWKLLLVPTLVLAGAFVPFLLADADMFWSPFRWQSGRPPWESLFAFANWLVGAPHEYTLPAFEDLGVGHNFGWVFWGITPPLTALTSSVPAQPVQWESVVAAVGTSVCLLAVLTARSNSPRSLLRWSAYALAVTFFWSPGWSPQYELYLVPLVALAFESPLAALGAVVALELTTFLEYPLFLPWAYFYGSSAVWLAWSAMLARYLVLGWLAFYVLLTEASLASLRGRIAGLRPVARQAAPAALALCVLLAPTTAAQAQSPATCAATRAAPPAPPLSLGDLDWSIPDGWFFTEAGLTGISGFSITDDADAHMWSDFNRLGGWQVLGFPASQRFTWHGQLTQATQRAVLQWSPIVGQVDFANILDLIHDEGRDAELLVQKQIPPPADVDEAGLPYEAIAANRLAWLDARPAIKDAYCHAPGGSDPIQLWGLPTSRAENMSPSGGEVYVLRTQRAAFQEWVDGAPFAAPGSVTIVLAGDLAKEFDMLPAEALQPRIAPR